MRGIVFGSRKAFGFYFQFNRNLVEDFYMGVSGTNLYLKTDQYSECGGFFSKWVLFHLAGPETGKAVSHDMGMTSTVSLHVCVTVFPKVVV